MYGTGAVKFLMIQPDTVMQQPYLFGVQLKSGVFAATRRKESAYILQYFCSYKNDTCSKKSANEF